MHFLFQVTWFCLIMCIRGTRTASNGLSPPHLYKQREIMFENRNSRRAIVSSVDESEVQHDIVMYWTDVFLGGVDINLILHGSRNERVRLQQITRKGSIRNMLRAKTMVYRVMIKPVPELKSVVIFSSEALPKFEKILIVKNNEEVYDFPLNQTSIGTVSNRTLPLARKYPAVSIRFTENGLCVNPVNADLPPPIVTRLVLRYNCGTLDTFFTLTGNKNLQHIASGLFVGDMAKQGIAATNYELSQVHVRLGVQSLGGQALPLKLGSPSQTSGGIGSQPQQVTTGKEKPLVELGVQKPSENLGSPSQTTGGIGNQPQQVTTGEEKPSVGLGVQKPSEKLSSPSQTTESIGNQPQQVTTGEEKPLVELGVQKPSEKLSSPSQTTGGIGNQPQQVITGEEKPSVELGVQKPSEKLSNPSQTTESIGNQPQQVKPSVELGVQKPSEKLSGPSQTTGSIGNQPQQVKPSVELGVQKPVSTEKGSIDLGNPQRDVDILARDSKKLVSNGRYDDSRLFGTNRKTASLGIVGGNRPNIFKNQHDDGELEDTGIIDNEKKIMDDEDVAMDKATVPQYPGLKHNQQYKAHSESQPVVARPLSTDDEKRSDITMRSTLTSEHVKLWLKPNSNLKFQLTSNLTKTAITTSAQTTKALPINVRDSILSYHASDVSRLNGSHNKEQFKKDHVIHGKTVRNRRAIVPKSYLQESVTGMCIGFQNMQVVLMPCESVSSSVQFYGKLKAAPAAPATEEPVPPSTPVVSSCGSTCPSTCAPSCAQSCCSSGYTSPQTSGLCGGECPSSCYPSCTSSCCGTGSQNSQGMSSSVSSSCPSSCSSAQTCPSSQCPQSCCSGAGGSSITQNQGGYSMSQGQSGYPMSQGQAGYPEMSQGLSMSQSQKCPSGCKKDCRSSCPFICC